MDLHLIRHPKTVAGDGVCYGRLDLEAHPDHLAADAQRLKAVIPPEAKIVSSPQRRALALAERLGEIAATDPRLVEMNFGDWENRLWEDLPRHDVDNLNADLGDYRPPGGETVREVATRVGAAFADIAQGDGPVVLVCHGGPIRLIGCLALGLPIAQNMRLQINWGHRSLLRQRAGQWIIAGWNL